jgi:hypothetical protein
MIKNIFKNLLKIKEMLTIKSKDEKIEIFILIWIFIHIYLYLVSSSYDSYYLDPYRGFERTEFWIFEKDLSIYDKSELFFYTMFPTLSYYIYKKYFK